MKGILVGLAIFAVSTSAAMPAHKTHAKPKAAAAATNPSPSVATPIIRPGAGVSDADRALYVKNLHDSGMKK